MESILNEKEWTKADYRDARLKWGRLNTAYLYLSILHDELPPSLHPRLDCWLRAMEEIQGAVEEHAPAVLGARESDLLGNWLNTICEYAGTRPLYPN